MTTVKVETVGIVNGVLDVPAPIGKSLAQGQYANIVVSSLSVLESFPDIAALVNADKIRLTEVDPPVPPPQAAVSVGDLNDVDSSLADFITQAVAALQADMSTMEQAFGSAIEGDAVLSLLFGDLTEDISAAMLNAAAAGEATGHFVASLKNADGVVHGWANFSPPVTPGYAAGGGGSGAAPAVEAAGAGTTDPPFFSSGQLAIDVTFDTDAGATKTYNVGDSITVTVDVSGLSLLSGVANLVKTYNVIA